MNDGVELKKPDLTVKNFNWSYGYDGFLILGKWLGNLPYMLGKSIYA